MKNILIRLKLIINPTFFISILILPFLILFLLQNIDFEKEKKLSVGIFFENAEKTEMLRKNIHYYMNDSSDISNIIEFENENSLVENILNYNIDCGFVVKESYGDTFGESIKLYKTNFSTSDVIMKGFIATIAIQDMSGQFGQSVLRKYLDTDKEIVKEEILQSTYEYTKDGSLMNIDYQYVNNGAKEMSERREYLSLEKIILGLFSSLSVFLAFTMIDKAVNERKSEIFNRIKLGDKYLINYNATYFFSFAIVIFSYLTLCIVIFGFIGDLQFNINSLIFANLFLSVVTSFMVILLINIMKSSKYTFLLSLYVFLFCLIFNESLFKIKDVISALEPLKFFNVVYYYLNML